MCGRYVFFDGKNQVIQEIIKVINMKYEQIEFSLNEVFPSEKSIVLKLVDNELVPDVMYWGYPYQKDKHLIINARYETIQEYFFNEDYEKRRCVVAVSGFFEWDVNKKKHYIQSSSKEPLYLAAIYRKINNEYYYCIITKPATKELKKIHDRMPYIFNREQAINYLLKNS